MFLDGVYDHIICCVGIFKSSKPWFLRHCFPGLVHFVGFGGWIFFRKSFLFLVAKRHQSVREGLVGKREQKKSTHTSSDATIV